MSGDHEHDYITTADGRNLEMNQEDHAAALRVIADKLGLRVRHVWQDSRWDRQLNKVIERCCDEPMVLHLEG